MPFAKLVPAALVAFLLAAFASVALATQTRTIESVIKMRPNFPAFHGRVKADNAACVEQRSVKMFKERRNGDKKLLGTDVTDSDGHWEVIVDPLKSGVYFAVVQKRREGTAGTIFVCTRDKSQVAAVD